MSEHESSKPIEVGDAVLTQHRGRSVIAKVTAIKADKARLSYVYTSTRGRMMSSQVHEPWRLLSSLARLSGPAPDAQSIMRGMLGLPEPEGKVT